MSEERLSQEDFFELVFELLSEYLYQHVPIPEWPAPLLETFDDPGFNAEALREFGDTEAYFKIFKNT